MANPSLQIGNDNWAIKEDNLLGYSTAGTRFVPQPITMTRATLGTRVNPSGLVEDVELLGSELVTNGDFATDSDWIKGTGWTISGGTAILDGTQTGGSSLSSSNMTVTVGKIYKVTVNVSATSPDFRLYDALGVVSYGLSLGENVFYRTPSSSTYTVTPLGLAGASGIVTNVSVKEATIDNLARVDYTDGTSSLLVEPQRTNLITYSEDFSQTDWQKIKSSVTSGFSSPDGGNNAYRWQEDTNSGVHSLKELYSFTSVDYSQTIFIKPNGRSNVLLWVDGASKGTRFDLSSGTIYSETSSVGKITAMNDGWFKISTTVLGTSGTAFNLYSLDNSGNISYTGDGTSGFYVYGAQLEVGSYPTSYIKTSGSTVTRNQETYTKTGISDLINSEEGVLFVEMAALSNDGTNRQISISDGTSSQRIYFGFRTTDNEIIMSSNNVASGSYNSVTHVLNNATLNNKFAFKYKENDFALWVNGVEVGTDLIGVVPSGLNKLSFDNGSGSSPFFGKVKQLQVFKTALTDSELATLTT